MGSVHLNPKLTSGQPIVRNSLGNAFASRTGQTMRLPSPVDIGKLPLPHLPVIHEPSRTPGEQRPRVHLPTVGRSNACLPSPLQTKPPGTPLDCQHPQQPWPQPLLTTLNSSSFFIFHPWKFPLLFHEVNEASERGWVIFRPKFLDVLLQKSLRIRNGSPFCSLFSSRLNL